MPQDKEMTDTAWLIGDAGDAESVTLRIYVAPRASSNRLVGEHNGALKVALTAPPVEGAANKALVEFLAKLLDVPRQNCTLISGMSSRSKTVRVTGITTQAARERLLAALG